MNMPGFDAESSLGPTMGVYRGKALFGRLGTGEVLPMQEFLASSTRSRKMTCCGLVMSPNGETYPVCRECPVPFFQDCQCCKLESGDPCPGYPVPPKCTPWVFF